MKQRTIKDIDAEIDALEDEMLEMDATGKEWDDCVEKRKELMLERIKVENPVWKREKVVYPKLKI